MTEYAAKQTQDASKPSALAANGGKTTQTDEQLKSRLAMPYAWDSLNHCRALSAETHLKHTTRITAVRSKWSGCARHTTSKHTL